MYKIRTISRYDATFVDVAGLDVAIKTDVMSVQVYPQNLCLC